MGLRTSKNRRRKGGAPRAARVQGLLADSVMGLFKLAVVGALGLGVFMGWKHGWRWATTTKDLALEKIHFSGLERTQAADLQRLAGVQVGQNLLLLAPDAVEKAMGAHPWVAQVEVNRHFPRALSVRVVEHQPRAFVGLGELYVVSSAGKPFKQLQADDALDLPLLSGVDREAYLASPDSWEERFRAAIEVLDAYERSAVARTARLSEVRLETDGLTLVTGEGEEVSMGEGGVEEKLERLERVRMELSRRGLRAERIRLDNRARPGWVAVELGELTAR